MPSWYRVNNIPPPPPPPLKIQIYIPFSNVIENDTKQILGRHMHVISERMNNEIVSLVLAATRCLPAETQSGTNSCYSPSDQFNSIQILYCFVYKKKMETNRQ